MVRDLDRNHQNHTARVHDASTTMEEEEDDDDNDETKSVQWDVDVKTSVMDAIRSMVYVGASRMASLRSHVSANEHNHNLWLVFTDGVSTIAPGSFPSATTTAARTTTATDTTTCTEKKRSKPTTTPVPSSPCPCYVFTASSVNNRSNLERLSETTGGRFFDLAAAVSSGTGEDAATFFRSIFAGPRANHQQRENDRHQHQSDVCFLGAVSDDRHVRDVHPSEPRRLRSGERLVVTGILNPGVEETVVELRYGIQGTNGRVSSVVVRKIRVSRRSCGPGTVIPRAWAADEVRRLENESSDQLQLHHGEEYDKVKKARNEEVKAKKMVAIGRKFGLVTPGTSLLVLETLEQFLKHDVEPPRSSPHREEFARRRRQRDVRREHKIIEKLRVVVGWWQNRLRWWNKDFKRALETSPLGSQWTTTMPWNRARYDSRREGWFCSSESGGSQSFSSFSAARCSSEERLDAEVYAWRKGCWRPPGTHLAVAEADGGCAPSMARHQRATAEEKEEGNAIYPSIPQYISQAPWYDVDGKGGVCRRLPASRRRRNSETLPRPSSVEQKSPTMPAMRWSAGVPVPAFISRTENQTQDEGFGRMEYLSHTANKRKSPQVLLTASPARQVRSRLGAMRRVPRRMVPKRGKVRTSETQSSQSTTVSSMHMIHNPAFPMATTMTTMMSSQSTNLRSMPMLRTTAFPMTETMATSLRTTTTANQESSQTMRLQHELCSRSRRPTDAEVDGLLPHDGFSVVNPPTQSEKTEFQQKGINCRFFSKIGACRRGDTCRYQHDRPAASKVVLIPHVYRYVYIEHVHSAPGTLIANNDSDFKRGCKDLWVRLVACGAVDQWVVENVGHHLRGNVYAVFATEEAARACCSQLRGVWIGGTCLRPELSPVTNLREAMCQLHRQGKCSRGGYCGFLHIRSLSKMVQDYGEMTTTSRNHTPIPTKFPGRLVPGRGSGNSWIKPGNNRCPEVTTSKRVSRLASLLVPLVKSNNLGGALELFSACHAQNENDRRQPGYLGLYFEFASIVFEESSSASSTLYQHTTPQNSPENKTSSEPSSSSPQHECCHAGWHRLGMLVITSVLDMGHGEANLKRMVAYRLFVEAQSLLENAALPESNQPSVLHESARVMMSLALELFEEMLSLRPEEPHSHLDLANGMAAQTRLLLQGLRSSPQEDDGTNSGSGGGGRCNSSSRGRLKDQVVRGIGCALKHFSKVVTGTWDSRFSEIELTALTELNAFVEHMKAVDWMNDYLRRHGKHALLDLSRREAPEERLPSVLLKNLDCDVRVCLSWDVDMVDVDLDVFEPFPGEKCDYSHRDTRIGGHLSRDFTKGYGPEEYMLRHAVPGRFKFFAKHFASHRADLAGSTTLMAKLTTDFGRPGKERTVHHALRLGKHKEYVDVGFVTCTR